MQHDLFVNENGWRDIPDFIISREGKRVNTAGDVWNLPYAVDTYSSRLDFSKISNENLKWALKAFVIAKIESVSTHAGAHHFHDVWREILRPYDLNSSLDLSEFETNLINLYEYGQSKT